MTSGNQLSVSEAFTEAILHDRYVILWRELQPFCLDHWILLEAIKSPLLFGGEITITDLQLAVQICSTSSIQEFYDVTLRPAYGWQVWKRFTRVCRVGPVLNQFNEYVDDYLPKFPRWRYQSDDETKCPPIFVSASRWIDSGHDPVKVRRMALGEMIAWSYAMAEAEGDPLKTLQSDAEVEAIREIAAEEAAKHG